MNWLLDRFGLDGAEVVIVLFSMFAVGLCVAGIFSLAAGRFVLLPFFAIAFSVCGILVSLVALVRKKPQ